MKRIYSGALLVALVLGAGFTTLSCKDDSNPVAPPAGGADVTIDIVGNETSGAAAFGSGPVTVNLNQKVAWRNLQNMAHTATSDAAGVFNTGLIPAGATSAAITMSTAGTFPYRCSVGGHNMTGTLTVNP